MTIKRPWDKNNKYTGAFLKEYTHWILEVSYSQHTLGSFIIFAKRSIEKISELESNELLELKTVMCEVENVMGRIDKLKPDRFNYMQLGNALHHLHIHGIPRYKKPRA